MTRNRTSEVLVTTEGDGYSMLVVFGRTGAPIEHDTLIVEVGEERYRLRVRVLPDDRLDVKCDMWLSAEEMLLLAGVIEQKERRIIEALQ